MWTTALTDLRNQLSDDLQNRMCYRKKVFGNVDGENLVFKTFEARLLTDFTSPGTEAEGVFIITGSVVEAVPASSITYMDPTSGEFAIANSLVPDDGSTVVATYYYTNYLDTELTSFLVNASNWLQIGADFTQMPPSLIPAALDFASRCALKFLSLKWADRASKAFLLEDTPKKEALGVAGSLNTLAAQYEKSATALRNDYYTKSGQSLAAFSRSSWGRASAITPRR